MKCIHLFTVLLSLNVTLAKYKWSDWSTKVSCARLCSQQKGVQILKRECQQCTNDNCVRTHEVHCNGTATKTESCYNPNECVGPGLYRGAWSPWSTGDSCPPDKEACRGAARYFVRRCLHRSLQVSDEVFKCPDIPTEKLEFCPCVGTSSSTWSQWTQWTECGCSSRIRSRMRRCWKMNEEACKGDGTESRGCTPDEVKCRSVTGRDNAAALSAKVIQGRIKREAPGMGARIFDSQPVVAVKVIESTGPIFDIRLPEKANLEVDHFKESTSRNSSFNTYGATAAPDSKIKYSFSDLGIMLPMIFGCLTGVSVAIFAHFFYNYRQKAYRSLREEEGREAKTPKSPLLPKAQ